MTPSAPVVTEELYSNTRAIYENFDPSKTKLLTDEGIYSAWSQLHAQVRQGHQNEGLSLEMPVMAYQPLTSSTQLRESDAAAYHTVQSQSVEVADSSTFDAQEVSHMYHELDPTSSDTEYSYIERSSWIMARQKPHLYEDIDSLKARADRLQARQSVEQERIERIESKLLQASVSLSSTNKSIEDNIAKVKEGIASISRLSSSSDLQLQTHSNRRVLIGMSEEQVCTSI